ncbi:MAG: GNAT family N-acetyltransferase [Symbiobacteriia bacterium]
MLRLHGNGHLTHKALRRYGSLQSAETQQEGNFILAALDEQDRCIGVAAALGWGHHLSLVAVAPRARGQGLAGRLLRLSVQALGRYYAEVAGDNLPSLRAFFACGLRAYDAFARPSGKVILRLRTVEPPPESAASPPDRGGPDAF